MKLLHHDGTVENELSLAESIFDTVREPLLVLDENLRVQIASRSFYEVFRVRPEETLDYRIDELGNGQWKIPALRELLEAVLSQNTHFDDFEVRHTFERIGARIMLLNARRVLNGGERILLAIEDITDTRRAIEGSFFFKSIVEEADDSVITVNFEGIITGWNKAAERIYGYPASETVGKHLSLLSMTGEFKPIQEGFERVKRGLRSERIEIKRRRKDGRLIHISVQLSPIRDAEGRLIGISTVSQDITERKRMEKEQERFFAVGADMLVIVGQNGYFKWVSPSWERATGWTAKELTSRPWIDFVHPEDREATIAEGERLFHGRETVRFENRYLKKDGGYLWISWKVKPFPEEQLLYGGATDVTELKQAEAARIHFRALFEAAPGAYLVLEPTSIFKIVGASAAYLKATLARREEIIDRPLFEAFPDPPEFPGASGMRNLRTSLERVIQHRQADVMPVQRYPVRRWGGHGAGFEERFWSVINSPVFGPGGRIEYIIHRVEDVTDFVRSKRQQDQTPAMQELESRAQHMEAEIFLRGQQLLQLNEKLRETEERNRLILENAKDFAIIAMDVNGRVTSWNPGAENLFGYAEAEVLGQNIDEWIFTPEDLANGIPEQERKSVMDEGHALDERWHKRKNGERLFVSGSMRPLLDSLGNLRGFIKVARDLTQRKQMEDELLAARENLEKTVQQRTSELQTKIGELEAFSYSVSHDLRAPLRAMQGFSKFLMEDYGGQIDERGRDYIDRIMKAAGRLDMLVQDVLAYSRVTRMNFALKPVVLERLIDEVIRDYPQIHASQTEILIIRPVHPVMGHAPSLTQCVSNLVGNAIKFVPQDRKPRVKIWTESINGKVRLNFEDNGIGIAPEHQERIFNMFEKIHHSSTFEGTGIGLAIVRKAVERMGGRVGVESEPGKGSRFWIELASPEG